MDVKGKNIFITGSTREIGKTMALAPAKAGANIILNDRGEVPEEKIGEIEAFGIRRVGVSGNISDYEKAGQMIKEVEKKLGSIYVLVNSAGVTNDKLVMRMNAKDFKKCLDINLIGTFSVTRYVLKKMMKQREGAVINLPSVPGLIGDIGQANYTASKAGIVGLTKFVTREAVIRGITCNTITPGFIITGMTKVLTDKVKEQAEKQIPMQRFEQVEDVIQTAVFSAQNPYTTGQVINVGGGLVMYG